MEVSKFLLYICIMATYVSAQELIGTSNIHVDMPGEHGNPFDNHPVVHRESHHLGHYPGSSIGNVHVDLPGQHGNPINNHPVVHKESDHFGHIPNVPIDNIHVDLPGQHGNPFDSHPVVHRESNHHGHIPDTPTVNVHVDLPGQHGNQINHPIVHKEPGHVGSNPGVLIGSVHIDMPGQHGNPINGVPVVHKEEIPIGPNPGKHVGNVHIDMHGNPVNGIPMVHRDPGHPVTVLGHKNLHLHSDIHIDAPGQHGNALNEPALHLPPGATIDDARAVGVIPGPVNVGPTVHLSESVGMHDYDKLDLGVVDSGSVLLTKGGRRRNGRRGGRRRGRGRGRGGRRRRPTTTTTTTTPAPKKSSGGGGITIIKTTRPNPLAAIGNALRSALNIGNGGGGLFGSLIRSAVGVQQGFRPPPGRTIRIQPAGMPLFGGLFG